MKYRISLFVLSALMLSITASAQLRIINTLAGNGFVGFNGDGFTAPAATLNGPLGVAVDATGNVYIEDFYNSRIRKVNNLKVITTVVGTGLPGNTGNGSVATNANIVPHGVAVDKKGNIYVSDALYSIVRKVNNLGIISTYAGTNIAGHMGDGGAATSARLYKPYGMTVDSKGNLYVADAGSNVIRKIDSLGKIWTVAGTDTASGYTGDGGAATSAKLDSPYSVAVDKIGNLYIADYKNNVIRMIDTAKNISTFAGLGTHGYSGDGGPATSAEFNNATGVAVDTFGNVYIADADNHVIRKVDLAGVITTVVGNGTPGFGGDLGNALGANLRSPVAVAVDKWGTLYIADANNQRIRIAYYSTVGVNDVPQGNVVAAYPNPFIDQITVSGLDKSDMVCVYDVIGRQVTEIFEVAEAGTETFGIKDLAPGMYVLRVINVKGEHKATVQLTK